MDEIKNKVADSGLVNFDLSELIPKGNRIGIDLKDFLFEGFVLREKDYRAQIAALDISKFEGAFVYIFCSTHAIIPLWAYFLIAARLAGTAQKVVYGNKENLEEQLLLDVIAENSFENLEQKRVLVKGCADEKISENAYIQLVEKLKPLVKSLMFGEACSNVPIFKN